MTVTRYAAGSLWLVGMALALTVPAVRWRERLCAGWAWVPARVVEAVLVWTAAVVIAEVLGAVGLFAPVPVLAATVAAGVLAWFVAPPPRPSRPVGREPMARWEPVAAIGIGAFVVAQWTARVVGAFGAGMTDVDTQSYHLPHAARFVQEGWLTRLHFIAPDEATAYHPSNGEIGHAFGMLAWHRDPLSVVVNLGWLVLLLGVAWCIGRRLGSGTVAVAGVAVVLACPLISSTQAASGMTDTVSVFFFLAAAYLVLVAQDVRHALPLAGLAAGLALGSKLTLVVPFVALSLAVVVLGRRLGQSVVRSAVAWLAPAFLTGSFWYLRNIVHVGNPIPTLRIGVDGVALPKPPIALEKYAYTVAHYAFDGRVWGDWFVPGLRRAFGPLWPVLLLLTVVAIAVAVWRGDVVTRALALVALAGETAYVFTQTTAFGPEGRPVLFAANLRYLMPALALALTLLPLAVPGRRAKAALAGGLTGLVAVTGFAANAWPADDRAVGVALGALAAAVALGLLWLLPRPAGARAAAILSAAVVIVGLGLGLPVTRRYLDRRYTVADTGQAAVGGWARGVHHVSVGIAGFFIQYPLYGQDLSNRVQYIGQFGSDHSFTDIRTCRPWRDAVNRGGYRFIVISPAFTSEPEPAALAWTNEAGAVTEVLAKDRAHVFRVDRPLHPGACPP